MEEVCKLISHWIHCSLSTINCAFGIKEFVPSCNGTRRLWKFHCNIREKFQTFPMKKAVSTKVLFVILSVTLFTLKRDVTERVLHGIVYFVCRWFFYVHKPYGSIEKMFYFKYLQYFYCNKKNIHLIERFQHIYIYFGIPEVRGELCRCQVRFGIRPDSASYNSCSLVDFAKHLGQRTPNENLSPVKDICNIIKSNED